MINNIFADKINSEYSHNGITQKELDIITSCFIADLIMNHGFSINYSTVSFSDSSIAFLLSDKNSQRFLLRFREKELENVNKLSYVIVQFGPIDNTYSFISKQETRVLIDIIKYKYYNTTRYFPISMLQELSKKINQRKDNRKFVTSTRYTIDNKNINNIKTIEPPVTIIRTFDEMKKHNKYYQIIQNNLLVKYVEFPA